MKHLLISIILVTFSVSVSAQVWVDSYTKKDGTYVQGHYRSSPNSTKMDNYSTKGNINPHTGKRGHKDPFDSSPYRSNSRNKTYGDRKYRPSSGYTDYWK